MSHDVTPNSLQILLFFSNHVNVMFAFSGQPLDQKHGEQERAEDHQADGRQLSADPGELYPDRHARPV